MAGKSLAETAAELMLVQYSADVDKRMIAFSVNVPRHCTQDDLDGAIDKMRNSVDRQKKFLQLAGAEANISNWEAQIHTTDFDITALNQKYHKKRIEYQNKGGRGEYEGMTASEQATMATQINDIERLRGQIEKERHRANELRAELKIDPPMQQAAE